MAVFVSSAHGIGAIKGPRSVLQASFDPTAPCKHGGAMLQESFATKLTTGHPEIMRKTKASPLFVSLYFPRRLQANNKNVDNSLALFLNSLTQLQTQESLMLWEVQLPHDLTRRFGMNQCMHALFSLSLSFPSFFFFLLPSGKKQTRECGLGF